ncbi:MAG: GNAT family N-acetyltransferase [Oscillospiraceae bacterium]|nr:GNAT family N-acetyltransferase [Oscillospiraceae bacterium]
MNNKLMIAKQEIIALFQRELPEILIGEHSVGDVLSDADNHFIYRREKDRLTGVSVINKNTIYLLLVDSQFQGHGTGISLLKESENYIRAKGYNKVTLGAGDSYIMPGVPMNRNAHVFFEKYGYIHSWGEEGCFDLSMPLCDFTCKQNKPGNIIDGNLYRFAQKDDIEGIVRCCSEGACGFAVHYKNDGIYKPGAKNPVFVAESNGEILAAIMAGIESEKKSVGFLGCLVTSPNHRNKGLGTNLVKLGTGYLKDSGLKTSWLSYTYTSIIGMYERIGYKVCMKYYMGEKLLKSSISAL